MPSWNLAAGDPLSLTISADARLTLTDYTDDQIWELILGGSEPPALALQTTYGLRAHWMRLFPRFVRGDTVRLDPASFHAPPRLVLFYPNFLAVEFAPFDGLDVLAEYWVPESQVVAGRLTVTNHSILPQNFRMEWIGLLNPIERQGGMVTQAVGPTCVLEGETAYLHPVVCLTGGPQPGSGPYPSLSLDLELLPGIDRQFSWACASLRSFETSLEAARLATARPWEAEQARMELLNFSQEVEIQTGNPDWDAALALSQKAARELLMHNRLNLPEVSFVLSRRPDQGFSARGDGTDYAYLWSGQTPLDAYYLTSLLLPGSPELAAGLLQNFLVFQDENGAIDGRPGLGGQRSKHLAQPLLASLAARIAPYIHQPGWHKDVFERLLRFFNAWFDPARDQDGDGLPEWEHPMQTGIEDSPIFDRWSNGPLSVDVARLESPALAAMLHRECQSLIELAEYQVEAEKAEAAYARLSGGLAAQRSGLEESLTGLHEREALLRAVLESTWEADKHTYAYRDYQTHQSLPGTQLATLTGSRRHALRRKFKQPTRLVIQLEALEERTYAASATIHGITADGEVSETLSPRAFSWLSSRAHAATQNTFLAIKRIDVLGMGDNDRIRVASADYTQEDCSLLLPLWSGALGEEHTAVLVRETLLPRYLLPYGIPLCPQNLERIEPDGSQTDDPQTASQANPAAVNVHLPWNHLIGEGLLRQGCRAEAAELVTRLMNAVALALKSNRAFRQTYNAYTGQASGERGHLHGLAPLGLFLQTLGIQKLDAREILIDGFNPFSSIVIVKYRKMTITCHPDHTDIVFPGGQSITVDQPGLNRISRTG